MAGTTLNRNYPYPSGGDNNDVPYWNQTLAEAIDADVQALYTQNAVTTTAGVWRLSANQSVANATFVLLSAATAVGTIGSGLSNSSGAITITTAGTYEVRAQIYWAGGAAAGTRRGALLTRNTTSINSGTGVLASGDLIRATMSPAAAVGVDQTVAVDTRFTAAAGDVLRVYLFQDSGGAVNAALGSDTHYMGRTFVSVQRVA